MQGYEFGTSFLIQSLQDTQEFTRKERRSTRGQITLAMFHPVVDLMTTLYAVDKTLTCLAISVLLLRNNTSKVVRKLANIILLKF